VTTGLELDAVTVTRQGSAVARDISLTVRPGRVLTLLGPNGAGKTTLLEALAGVIGLASGRATLDGTDLGRLSRAARARAGLALVEQGRRVFGSLTVAENIRVAGGDEAAVAACLELFPPLRPRRDLRAALLSGGEQQMLVLARALARRPRVLMLDEMSLGLAPVIVQRLLPTVRALADEGMAVLLVEQFATLALRIADDAVVLASGRMTFAGPAARLAASPAELHRAYLGTGAAVPDHPWLPGDSTS
jgi:branched-chain amino acid transport system ATP-binding protein